MANATFKKILILFLFIFIYSLDIYSQNKVRLTVFSEDFSSYLAELDGFMQNNEDAKLVYKKFKKVANNLNKKEQDKIISISNKMLSKRLRAKPYFSNFLLTITSFNNRNNREFLLFEWLSVVEEMLDNTTNNKLLLFFASTNNLLTDGILRSSKSAQWSVSPTDFHFKFEGIEPVIVFDSACDITCSSKDGSYTIYKTKGRYYSISTEWFGETGLISWELYGYPKDSIFSQLKSYSIDTRRSEIIADSSIFYNKYIFSQPLVGKLVNKISTGKQALMYPKFTSYRKNVKLQEIFPNIDYRGGYILQGKEFIADGGDRAQANVVFKRNGKEVFIANANRFIIDDEKISAQEAGVKIFFDNDSIYHGHAQFKYIDSDRVLQLYRKVNDLSGSPMLNTYHNVTMNFELLQWNIDTELITFGSLPGSAESRVDFESVDRYVQSKFESMQGVDAVHPLILVSNYVSFSQEESFSVNDFANYAGFPYTQIQHYLIQLANDGFIFYNHAIDMITVLPKLYNYINAASELGDYDVISFNSVIRSGEYKTGDKHLVNATLNIETKDLNIIGIHSVEVSKNRGVYLYPRNGLIIVKKNRNFIFNGQVLAGRGRLNLFGSDFLFHYEDFKVDLNYIDSVQLSVPVKPIQKDMYNNEILTPVRTVIEAVKGDLRIDHPTNKSGIRKDSFPNFPIFSSHHDSYAYYDRPSIYGGIYNRDIFSFHLQPFQIDSLDNYTGNGLWFAGTFESAGIFPTFNDTLSLQKDYSLGFNRKTPDDGFLIYGGKARYYNDIHLSHGGLKGSGDFEYLSCKASTDDILFLPDSINFYTKSFEISEVVKGVEFPAVKNTETYAHFEPYNDRLDIYKTKSDFDFYRSEGVFSGDLLIRPSGLTGSGIITLDKAEVNANLFTFNANWFGSKSASLEVFDNVRNLAFKANDLKTHIDLKIREGVFYSNGSGSYVELPANQYVSYIDNLRWRMDEEYITLGDEVASAQGSKFVSIHPQQDSLSFIAKAAFYSLKDYIINASGVDSIEVADAIIYPDSGIVTVAKDTYIQTLYQSKIIADNLMRYHIFNNATVDIESANSYRASANYTYKDALENEQQIFFKSISVDQDTITIAKGNVSSENIFHIDSKFDFKGDIDLIADQKDLIFDGFFMVNHDCYLLDKEWVRFRSNIDPQNIIFNLEEKLYNEKDDILSTAIVMSFDSTDFYSTFLSKKSRSTLDISILEANYNLQYDSNKSAYIVGGPDSLANYYTLYDKVCSTYGEGIINLDLNLGQINLQTIGNVSHNMISKQTEVEGFLMLDFFFLEDALKIMAEDFYGAPGEDLFEYDNNFMKNLGRVVGKERAESLLLDLEMTDEYSKFPDEMKHSIVFAKTKLRWDVKNKAYVAKGSIAVSSIMDRQVNSILDGYLIIEKGTNMDVLTIYLQTELYDEYYFYFKNGVMQAWSTNIDFNAAIEKVDVEKRKAKKVKGGRTYRYMSAPEDVTEKFLKQVKKKF